MEVSERRKGQNRLNQRACRERRKRTADMESLIEEPVGNSQRKMNDNNVQNSQLESTLGEGTGMSAPLKGRRRRKFNYTQEQHDEAKRQRDEAKRRQTQIRKRIASLRNKTSQLSAATSLWIVVVTYDPVKRKHNTLIPNPQHIQPSSGNYLIQDAMSEISKWPKEDGVNEDNEDNRINEDDEDNGINEDDEDDEDNGINEDDEDNGINEDEEDNGINEDVEYSDSLNSDDSRLARRQLHTSIQVAATYKDDIRRRADSIQRSDEDEDEDDLQNKRQKTIHNSIRTFRGLPSENTIEVAGLQTLEPPKIQFYLQSASGAINFQCLLRSEEFRDATISQFYTICSEKSAIPLSSLQSLTFLVIFAHYVKILVTKEDNEENWLNLKKRISVLYRIARSERPQETQFEVWVQLSDTTSVQVLDDNNKLAGL